ncbi:MAG: hypothetical protein HY245_12960, partial [Rhizobiales bacterium]|nr:hypothetical protein [Hyphomicrobiales bacterium]
MVTPAGERSGSAVLAVYVNSGKPFLTPNVGVRYGLKGEATVVEVAPGKYLFALLDDQRTPELAMQTWLPSLPKKQWDDVDAVFQTIQDARETRPVPREFYPLLVTFGNLGNPASVREVKP